MYINWEKQTLNQQLELSVPFNVFLVHYISNIIILLIFVLSFSWFMSKYHYCRPVI